MAIPSPKRPQLPAVITKPHLLQALKVLNIPTERLSQLDIDVSNVRLTYINVDEDNNVIHHHDGSIRYTTYLIPLR